MASTKIVEYANNNADELEYYFSPRQQGKTHTYVISQETQDEIECVSLENLWKKQEQVEKWVLKRKSRFNSRIEHLYLKKGKLLQNIHRNLKYIK